MPGAIQPHGALLAFAPSLERAATASINVADTDSGVGMSPDVIKRAFDPFFTTKPLGQGTGLGLSMIYGFARQSNGQVRIYSEIGQGTTMCIYLPRHIGVADEALGATVEQRPPSQTESGKMVLIVDDEPTVRMLVAEVLADAGFATIEAKDGPSALKLLASAARIDPLITDVGLPGGMNGRQVSDAARSARPRLKVLFITGYAENAAVGKRLLPIAILRGLMTELLFELSEALAHLHWHEGRGYQHCNFPCTGAM